MVTTPDKFTHRFVFSVGEGSEHIRGRIELNTDGKASFTCDKMGSRIDSGTLAAFSEWVKLMKKYYDEFGGIVHIRIVEMNQVDAEVKKTVTEAITDKTV